MNSTPDTPIKSKPRQAFENNLDHLLRLMNMRRGNIPSMLDTAPKILEELQTKVLPTGYFSKEDRQEAIDKIEELVLKQRQITGFLNNWQLVILVSFVEAYLEDVLIVLVGVNPEWMRRSAQSATYADLIEAHSLSEIIENMHRRWAKNILSSDKPVNWIRRLVKFGCSGYREGLELEMATLWKKRHTIVHAPQVAPFMSTEDFKNALDVIRAFVNPTDSFVVNFSKAHEKRVEQLPNEGQ